MPLITSLIAALLYAVAAWKTARAAQGDALSQRLLLPAALLLHAAALVGETTQGPELLIGVGAAASLHGGGLVTRDTDSPHLLLAATQASYLFAIARNDDAKEPAVKDTLRTTAAAAKRPAEIEVYAADHGWTVPDSPAYDPVEADRAWQRMLALFGTL